MRGLSTIALLVFACARVFAQADDSVAFEAASIKLFAEGTPIQMIGCQGGPGSGDPGRINCSCVSLKMLLAQAYKLKSQEIFGPGWMDSAHFDITAKLPAGATRQQVPLMYRNLLAERFKVVLHRETRPIPVYSLTVAKGGLKIREAVPAPAATQNSAPAGPPKVGDDGFPILRPAMYAGGAIILFRQGRARLQGGSVLLSQLAESLSNQLDRVVIDETGLTGKYDIRLDWTPDASEPGGHPGRKRAPRNPTCSWRPNSNSA